MGLEAKCVFPDEAVINMQFLDFSVFFTPFYFVILQIITPVIY